MSDGTAIVDEWLVDYARAIAAERNDLHSSHKSSRPLSENYEVVGLSGEFEFGRLVGLMPDLSQRPEGDKGVDFIVSMPLSVDVKTARKALNLIHERGKPFADIYVLAEFDEQRQRATIVGWAYGTTLKSAPSKDFGYGVINHYIPRESLRPICELVNRLKP
jgi:hypothetical protein